MKSSILPPKLTFSPPYESIDITPRSYRLEIKSQQNLDIESFLGNQYPRVPLSNVQYLPSREIDPNPSIDIGVTSPSNRIIPHSTTSAAKLLMQSPTAALTRNMSTPLSRTGSLAQNYMKNPDKMLINIPEETLLPSIDPKTLSTFRMATERIERSNDYFDTFVEKPQLKTSRSGSKRIINFNTAYQTGFLRFRTETFEESVYEKTSQITEQGSKIYKKKVSALNFAEMRKTFFGPRNYSQDLTRTDGFISLIPSARSRQLSQVNTAKTEGDGGFFTTAVDLQPEDSKNMEIENSQERLETVEIEIAENQMNSIELEKSVPTYIKINVIEKYSPLTITIAGAKNIKRIKTFVSITNQKPSKQDCDDRFESRSFKLYEKNRASPRFLHNFYYIGLLPNESGSVTLKLEFAQKKPPTLNDKTKSQGKSLMRKHGQFQYMSINLEKRDLYFEIGKIKKERKERMLLLSQGVDKVEFNKNIEQYIPSRACERREMLKQKKEDLLRVVQSKKTVIDQEKQCMRKANAVKHDLQKMIKEIASMETRKALALKFCLENWFVNILFCKLGESMKAILKKEREARDKRERLMTHMAMFAAKMQTALVKRGDTVTDRLTFDIRMALQMHAKVFKKHKMPEVKHVIISFLRDNMVIHYMKNKFINTFRSIKKVQDTFRVYLKRKEGFKTCMLLLWDKNYMKIYHETMITTGSATVSQVGGNQKPVLRKLQTIDLTVIEVARKKFVKIWFRRCLARYKQNYEVHSAELEKLSYEARQQWHLQNMFAHPEQKLRDVPLINQIRKFSRQGLMEEFKKNHVAYADYTAENVSQEQKLVQPRLFLIPTQEDLEATIKQVILMQKTGSKML